MSSELAAFWVTLQPLLAVLGLGGLTVAGIVFASYQLFKWYGGKWVDQRFQKELEGFKSEHQRELERLRHKINAVFDRTIRLHSKEFEVLPEIWGRLVDARSWAGAYIAVFRQYADVGRMGDEELKEFLIGTEFSEAHKREVLDESARNRRQNIYNELSDAYLYRKANQIMIDFNGYFRKNGIFVQPELKGKIDKLFDMLHGAMLEHRINTEDKPVPRMRDAYKLLDSEGKALFAEIEQEVAKRLWDSVTAEV